MTAKEDEGQRFSPSLDLVLGFVVILFFLFLLHHKQKEKSDDCCVVMIDQKSTKHLYFPLLHVTDQSPLQETRDQD